MITDVNVGLFKLNRSPAELSCCPLVEALLQQLQLCESSAPGDG